MLNTGMFIQNRYEIISKIGSGGMAHVYKAKDHKLNRYVAIKVLKDEFRDDKGLVSKFRTEAQSAAGLAHGNIVNIYDVGEEAGINYIVMEYVEGITLKEYIKDQGHLSAKEATSITLQISAGLEAAHNNGIIHRDVKPQNIMISTDGKVKVADFGIARASTVNTMTSNVMGSVHYSSPEQARGGYSDERSDIYSLGITMYEMLTGHVPFNGDTAVAVALQHLQDELHGPKEEIPDIPYSTNQIVLKCTQKSPDRRYSNMTELIQDLRESLVNPDGDFVKIDMDSSSPTIVMSKEEIDQLKSEQKKSEQQKMPSYDESINVGVAADIHKEGEQPEQNRAYQPGSYYQKSQYQGSLSGHQDDYYDTDSWNTGYGMDDLENIDDPEYHPYYDDQYDDQEEAGISGTDADDTYNLDDTGSGSKKRKKKDDMDGDLNPNLERAVTIGGIVIAVVVACIFLILLGNAFGLFRFSGNRESDTNIVIIESETEKQTEAMTQAAAPAETEKEPASEKEAETETEKETETEIETETKAETAGTFALDDLSNMEQYEAEEVLTSEGLGYTIDTTQFNDTVPEGYVISTNPEAGMDVTAGDVITLFISQGSEANATYVTLWDLTGYTQDRAEEALQMLGLSSTYEYEPSNTVPEGNVTRTSADEDDGEARSGSVVTVYISTGPSDELDEEEEEEEEDNQASDSDSETTTASSSSSTEKKTSETSSTETNSNVSGDWQCDADLTAPTGYNGEEVKITLEQNGEETTVFEGTTAFPYHLQVAGEDEVTDGTAYVYMLDDDGKVIKKIEYPGIMFTQVE